MPYKEIVVKDLPPPHKDPILIERLEYSCDEVMERLKEAYLDEEPHPEMKVTVLDSLSNPRPVMHRVKNGAVIIEDETVKELDEIMMEYTAKPQSFYSTKHLDPNYGKKGLSFHLASGKTKKQRAKAKAKNKMVKASRKKNRK